VDNSTQFRRKMACFRLAGLVFLFRELIHVSTIAQKGLKSDPGS
jgi:hypothetical protein